MPKRTPSQADHPPGTAPPEAPPDPRRAPDVLFALAQAARRDPHPDPIKPIGRASFLIWLAILGTLFLAAVPAQKYVDVPKFRTEILMSYQSVVDATKSEVRFNREVRKLQRSQHKMEMMAVTGFAAGTLLFALYYFVIYIVGMNTKRVLNEAGLAINASAKRLAAWRERMRQESKSSRRVIIEQTTAAGPEPTLH